MATRKKAAGARPASAQLMREALLRSLQREQGKVLKGRQRLQLAADALVDAAIEGDMAALREVFQRVDGKLSDAPSGGEGKRPVDLEIQWPKKVEKIQSATTTTPAGAESSKP
jgi:hypothetical protein